MRFSDALNGAFSEQIVNELANSSAYLQMAIYFDILQFRNLAGFFYKQAQHERDHADKIVKYMCSRTGSNPMVGSVPAPALNISSPVAVGEEFVRLEEKTTADLENIYELVTGEASWMDVPFIQEMLAEQVEEEDEATHFLDLIKEAKDLALFDMAWGD